MVMIGDKGSPMKEIILAHEKEINESKVLETLNLTEKNYIVLSSHREENIDNEENFVSRYRYQRNSHFFQR